MVQEVILSVSTTDRDIFAWIARMMVEGALVYVSTPKGEHFASIARQMVLGVVFSVLTSSGKTDVVSVLMRASWEHNSVSTRLIEYCVAYANMRVLEVNPFANTAIRNFYAPRTAHHVQGNTFVSTA